MRYFFTILLVNCIFLCNAQTFNEVDIVKKDTIKSCGTYTNFKFKGGLELPENVPPGKYTVYVSFIVTEDAITNIEIIKDPGHGMGEAVKKALKKLPRYNSEDFRKMSREQYSVPIYIRIEP
jgi:hypothetical protein